MIVPVDYRRMTLLSYKKSHKITIHSKKEVWQYFACICKRRFSCTFHLTLIISSVTFYIEAVWSLWGPVSELHINRSVTFIFTHIGGAQLFVLHACTLSAMMKWKLLTDLNYITRVIRHPIMIADHNIITKQLKWTSWKIIYRYIW